MKKGKTKKISQFSKRSKIIIISVLVVLLALVIFRIVSCASHKINADSVSNDIPVKAAAAKIQDLDYKVNFTGNIVGTEVVSVYSQVTGKVNSVNINEGQKVYRGQTLFTIDRDIVGMTYNFNKVTSPITGYVGTIKVDKGMTVTQSVPLTEVVNMKRVEAVFRLMEEQINFVHTGMVAKIKVSAYPNKIFKGRISKKSAVLDLASRTQEVHIDINNPGMKLRHGMFADIEILAKHYDNVLTIPEDAIFDNEDGTHSVFVVEDDKAKRKEIIMGQTIAGATIIKKGLKEGEVVATLGKENANEGAKLLVYREDLPKDKNSNKPAVKKTEEKK